MLIQKIDEYLQARPKDERATHCFHPSSLHKSENYLFEAYLNGDNAEQFPSRVLRIFDNGTLVHERLQNYLKEIGILKQAEVPLHNAEYEIKGHADGIIEIAGQEGVLEIKSINTKGFYSLQEPKTEHILQVNVYMFCLDIPRGVLLYECKDNQELKNFFLKQDEAILKPVLNKIRRVQDRIRKHIGGHRIKCQF